MIATPIGSLTLGFGWEHHDWRDVQEWKLKLDWLEEHMSPSDLKMAKELLDVRASKILRRLAQRDDR